MMVKHSWETYVPLCSYFINIENFRMFSPLSKGPRESHYYFFLSNSCLCNLYPIFDLHRVEICFLYEYKNFLRGEIIKFNVYWLSGKFIVAYIPTCQEKEYYLACACEEIYAPPSAYVSLFGLTVQASFLRGKLTSFLCFISCTQTLFLRG